MYLLPACYWGKISDVDLGGSFIRTHITRDERHTSGDRRGEGTHVLSNRKMEILSSMPCND